MTEEGLRYSLHIPESEKFTVGDIMIGGEQIQYGGTVARLMDVGLTAEFCTNESGTGNAYPCVGLSRESKVSSYAGGSMKGKAYCVPRASNKIHAV